MITGFYDNSSATNQQPHVVVQRISGGETYQGRVASAAENKPNNWVDNDVYALKSAIETALSTSLPANLNAKVFRIDYSGVVYGDRGYHFPLVVV